MFFLLSRICLRWMWSLTDTVVWTWLASGSSTLRTAKWPQSSRNGPWSDFRLHPNLTLVYWTASWLWVSWTKWMNEWVVNEWIPLPVLQSVYSYQSCCQRQVFMTWLSSAQCNRGCVTWVSDTYWWEHIHQHHPFAPCLLRSLSHLSLGSFVQHEWKNMILISSGPFHVHASCSQRGVNWHMTCLRTDTS